MLINNSYDACNCTNSQDGDPFGDGSCLLTSETYTSNDSNELIQIAPSSVIRNPTHSPVGIGAQDSQSLQPLSTLIGLRRGLKYQ